MASAVLVRFSDVYKVPKNAFRTEKLFEPLMNSDTRLFLDPLLIEKSSNSIIAQSGLDMISKRFSNILALIEASQKIGDAAWRSARGLMDLSERSETCLGFGDGRISGSSRSEKLKDQILGTLKEIIKLGEKDPQIVGLMALFEEGVGADTISDLTTTCIRLALEEITHNFCKKYKIPVQKFPGYQFSLPVNPLRSGKPVILLPKDLLRDLPYSADWDDLDSTITQVREIRNSFNAFIGKINELTITKRKQIVKDAIFSSVENLRQILNILRDNIESLSENANPSSAHALLEMIDDNPEKFKLNIEKSASKGKKEVIRIVDEIIGNFKRLVEKNGLWKIFWHEGKAVDEGVAQLLFRAVADVFCKVNDIDVSPETNSGPGPVDFKFSIGYNNKVIVELKKSTGSVLPGYQEQVEAYKQAEETDAAFYLVLDVGKMGQKLKLVEAAETKGKKEGRNMPAIRYVNARQQISASKRRSPHRKKF